MSTKSPVNARTVLILKFDRMYAEVLRQFTLRVFPRACVRLASSVHAARLILEAERVDVFVTGVGASLDGDALDLVAQCAQPGPQRTRVLVVTARREYRVLATLRALDIEGVFDSAGEPPEQFMSALRAVATGGRYWSLGFLDHMQRIGAAEGALFRVLTACEQMALSVLGDGCDDTLAAHELGLSPSTVSTIRRDLHRKLRVQHRGELMRLAAQHGFVRFTPEGVVRPGFALLRAAYRARKGRRPYSPLADERACVATPVTMAA